MSAESLLDELRRLGVQLSQRDGKLICDAPKGALTSDLRQQIAQSKAELLVLLQNEPIKTAPADSIPIVSRDGRLPLSFSQERIWKLSKIVPERNVTGNLPFAFRISGPLNACALERSIAAIVQRHEVFRACCKVVDGEQTLAILPSLLLDFPIHDLRHLARDQAELEIETRTREFVLIPFDLEKPPMLRVMLLHFAANEYVFLLMTHVFAFDGASTPILLGELSAFYSSFVSGKDLVLPRLSPGYADFAAWHRQSLRGASLVAQKAYWKKTLQSVSVMKTTVISSNLSSATLPITFPDFLAEAVREVSKHAGVTLFVTLMAVLQTLLQRYSLDQSIAVGTIVSNRRGAATESMIGSFANNILLRADFPAGSTFRSVLLRARNAALTTFAHQDLPFETLLGELDAPLVQEPLFRVMFVFHQHRSMDQHGPRFDGLTVDMRPLDKRQSNYLLDLVLTDVDGKLSGILEYNTSAFTSLAAQSFVERYLFIAKMVSTNPDLLIEELPTFGDGVFGRHPETSSPKRTVSSSSTQMTAVEQTLSEIWKRHLRVDIVDKDDDFFDVGGHSLLALALIEEVESTFRMTNLVDAFAHQRTFASLAKAIESRART